VKIDVYGRFFNVRVRKENGLTFVDSASNAPSELPTFVSTPARRLRIRDDQAMSVFGYSEEHAMKNMRYALCCLLQIEAGLRSS